jgi:hypothetical protein
VDDDQRDRRDSADAEDASAVSPDSTQPSPTEEPAAPEQPQDAPGGAPPPDEGAPSPAEQVPPTDEAAAEPAEPAEPERATPPADTGGTAEFESWPSADATDAAQAEAPPAWPTEPPAAGSADADAWPTEAPERGEEPAWSHAADEQAAAAEPPPPEVEAYPAADAAAVAAAATAAHSVPAGETATGESTQCPRCGTENRPGLAFCRNCGQRLVAAGVASTVERPGAPEGTMACPRCGTHNRAGVAFCQNCGANLRGTAPGYVPPAVAAEAAAEPVEARRGGAVLGPVVLLIGLVGIVTGYLLPFLYGTGSLFERASGSDGYGAAFWTAYPDVGAQLADQVYFGLAGPIPLLAAVLLLLAGAGFVRGTPGAIQVVGLVIALLWSVGLIVLFVVVELLGNWGGDLVGLLRELTPAGIIFFLSSLIILIGTLTRFGRS